MEDGQDVLVSKEMLKAIGADTRINILKSLKERKKTQSELANELKLSAPTVLEHVHQLENSKLIEKVEDSVERKWKYYKLSSTGMKLVGGKRMNIVLVLSFLVLAVIGALAILYNSPFNNQGTALTSITKGSSLPSQMHSLEKTTPSSSFVIEKQTDTKNNPNPQLLNNQTSQNSSIRDPFEAPALSRSVVSEPKDQPPPGVKSSEPAPAIQENNNNMTSHTQNNSG